MAFDMFTGDVTRIKRELGLTTKRDHDKLINRLESLKSGSIKDSSPKQLMDHRVEPKKEKASIAELTMPEVPVNPLKTLEEKRYEKLLKDIKLLDQCYQDFSIPKNEQPKFIRGYRLGKRFWASVYSVPQVIIKREYKRLVPNINIEDIPS
jgi:hypothetical protein